MNVALSARYGPTTTLARNVAATVSAIVGLAVMVLPTVQGVQPPRSLYFGALGAMMVVVFFVNAFRWKGITSRATREAKAAGAGACFAFMQADFASGDGQHTYPGSGWVVASDETLVIVFRRSTIGIGSARQRREIRLDAVKGVFPHDTTSMSYGGVVIVMTSGEELFFMLAPRNGSGLRGPSDVEITTAVADLSSLIEA